MLAPATTAEYAQDYDSAVLSAFSTLLGTGDLPRHTHDIDQLPLSLGGLGLASAVRNSVPAFWASWADCLAILSRRLPRVTQEFLNHLDSPDPQPACFAAATAARAALGHSDWAPPTWRELSAGENAPMMQEEGPSTFLRDWQGQAAAVEARRHREHLPVPSLRRPSCNLRPVRCAPGARVSARACGRMHLQRNWSQNHLQDTPCGLEPSN